MSKREYIERLDKLRKEHRGRLYIIQKHTLWDLLDNSIGEPIFTWGLSGLPKDCILENIGFHEVTNGLALYLLHESFEPLQEGTVPVFHHIDVTIHTLPLPPSK